MNQYTNKNIFLNYTSNFVLMSFRSLYNDNSAKYTLYTYKLNGSLYTVNWIGFGRSWQ